MKRSAGSLGSRPMFWNGSEKDPAEIAPLEDRIFLQGISPEKVGYSRKIMAVGKDFIIRHYDAYGGPKPPPIDHQGIDDAFVGKGIIGLVFLRREVVEGDWGGLMVAATPVASDGQHDCR
jgi:hypothetical protein